MFEINTAKRILVHIRTSIKFLTLIAAAAVMILGLVAFSYKPIYSVSFKGEQVGYCQDKAELQKKINEYMKIGEGNNVAFVEIEELPTYEMCMSKKDIETNDDEIFEKVKSTGVTYYKYYAVTLESQEKFYVSSEDEAIAVIEELKEKNSTNKEQLGFVAKYLTELKDFTSADTIVAELYVKPVEKKVVAVSTAANTSGSKVNIGITLAKPTSGTISSRFGSRWGSTHTGLDIAGPVGTTIKAAANGTVTFAGWNGSYGYMIKLSHGNGIETYYCHCSSLMVSEGQSVSVGEKIAEMGSTGNSTGSHLHLEVRVNGVAQNPQNYVY